MPQEICNILLRTSVPSRTSWKFYGYVSVAADQAWPAH